MNINFNEAKFFEELGNDKIYSVIIPIEDFNRLDLIDPNIIVDVTNGEITATSLYDGEDHETFYNLTEEEKGEIIDLFRNLELITA